jgi:hypothetical protein
MGSRAWKLVAVAVLAAVGAAGAVLPGVARARVQAALDERCRRTLESVCSFADARLAVDGVLVRDLTVRARGGRYVARAHRVGLRLRWGRLLLGMPQEVEVDVDGVELRGRATLGELRDDLRQRSGVEPGPSRRGRLRVRAVHVTGVEGSLTLHGLGAPVELRLRHGGLDAAREGATSARWTELSAVGPGLSARTGACTVLHGIDAADSLDCRDFEGEMDVARLGALRAVIERGLAAGPPAGGDLRGEGGRGEGSSLGGGQAQARFQEGRVRIKHGEAVIADLAPAGVSALVEGGTLREASLQLGGLDARQTSLSLSFNRMHEPWQVELEAGALPLRELAPWVPAVPWHDTAAGRAHARVHVEPGEAAGQLEVSGDLFVEHFGLEHSGLAREPIDGLSVSLDGRMTVDLARRRISTPGLNWQVNGIPFTIAGWGERGEGRTALDVSLRAPALSCENALRSFPRPVAGIASGLGLAGSISADAHLALDTRRLSETVFHFNVQDACTVVLADAALGVQRFGGPFVQRAREPGGNLRAFVTGPGTPAWVPIEALPPNLLNAVVAREDGGFYRHRGFSPGEIRGALVRNIAEGRYAYGASTISMQLVKNVFLAREKTLVRKLQEVVLTWWIEQSLSKSAILELYLNVVEFGPGIYGIGPAARFFFGREPRELSTLQALYLATLLPAPVPRFAIFQRGAPGADTLARLRGLARAMAANRLMEPADAEAAQGETFTFRAATAPVPGAQTLTVDPATTDEVARALAERAMVQVRLADPAGAGEGAGAGAGEGAGTGAGAGAGFQPDSASR